jgi:hypothetical protein
LSATRRSGSRRASRSLAVGAQLILWWRGAPRRTLDVGNLAVFAVLALAAFVVPDDVLARWLQPLVSAVGVADRPASPEP